MSLSEFWIYLGVLAASVMAGMLIANWQISTSQNPRGHRRSRRS